MTHRGRLPLAWGVAGSLLLWTGCGGSAKTTPVQPLPASSTTAASAPKPNIVVVVADDLDSLTHDALPRMPDLLARQGLSFTRAYVTTPLCSPSRASILTGQYAHNHGVTGNAAPAQGFPGFRPSEAATLAVWLKAAGYRTSMVGKYLNDYAWGAGEGYIPPGWDDWYGHLAALEDGRYFNYWVNDNGDVSRKGARPEDYSVDAETNRAVSFIHSSAGRPEPLFLYLAPQAPHVPAMYPERYGADFRDSECPRVASFNEGNVGDKPSWVRQITLLDKPSIDKADELQRWRLRSMRAVEDEIDAVIQAMAVTGRMQNTYIIYVSDNGALMGQHRAVARKNNSYEEVARVPFYVRGPGVPVAKVDQPVLNIDIAPTLLELAGAPVPETVDGRSLVPFLRGGRPESWRQEVMIESWGVGPTYALATTDWVYVHNDTEELELYDMRIDPYQVDSLHRKVESSVLAGYEQRIRTLMACRGASCRK